MFCSDPVIRVYEGSMFGHTVSDSVLNCCSGIAYHCTPGCRMILETRHEFISIGADGVHRQVRVPVAQIAKPGEQGELLLDFVSDYVVRCKSCGKSTRAELYAIRAIEDWNQGDTPCECSGIGDL